MCKFISWIEKDGQVFFLTHKDIYTGKRGKELRDYCASESDYIGHGAIRYFYDNFQGGEDLECTDFSTPKNFPSEIVSAIKKGKFRGLGAAKDLLNAKAQKAYYAAMSEPQKAYYAAMSEAQKAYYAARSEFWDLFKIKKNRNPLWR